VTSLAITGLGIVAPAAMNREALFDALRNGDARAKAAFGPAATFDGALYGGACITEIQTFDPTPVLGDKGLRNLDRVTKLFLVAARGVLEDSGIKQGSEFKHYAGPRVGVCASTAYGSLEAMMELDRVAVLENPRYLNPSKFPNTVINSALGYVSIWDDLRALNATVCNGNCGGLDSVLLAETYVASGRADAILVGGAEAMHEALYMAFDRLDSLATLDRKYAPGDASSQGMRLGEGSVLLSLERDTDAKSRSAKVWAHIVGYGTSFEPPDSEALLVHMDVDAIARSIEFALADAGVAAKEVDLVVSCVDGVAQYDKAEAEALARVFGDRVGVVAPKMLFGETLGASGAFGMAAGVAYLNGVPAAPLRLRGEVPDAPKCVLVTAVGFYGNASAVVLQR
jgi:3-oxoacyl-(acyl-carrier-protein) synthase